ncbi:hypothetical protein LQ938_11580 [Microbacterium sp. cx-55]|nr:hypothetical protein [Microbacterium sp. cx-55]UGB34507.1 hypothetical protein LQ938_11580 [Microbacterium sp. cx-55]
MPIKDVGESFTIWHCEPNAAIRRVHYNRACRPNLSIQPIAHSCQLGQRLAEMLGDSRKGWKHLGGEYDVRNPDGRWVHIDSLEQPRDATEYQTRILIGARTQVFTERRQ